MTAVVLGLSTSLAMLLAGPTLHTDNAWTITPAGQIRARWADTGDAERMVRIAQRESGLTCDAANPHSSARGLFQILTSLHRPLIVSMGLTVEQVSTECPANIDVAWVLYQQAGTDPWRLTR